MPSVAALLERAAFASSRDPGSGSGVAAVANPTLEIASMAANAMAGPARRTGPRMCDRCINEHLLSGTTDRGVGIDGRMRQPS